MTINCPYCGSQAKLVDSSIIYHGRSYGNAWVCSNFPKCDAYVGCHKGTEKPLGRLADKTLRVAKGEAHKLFDHLWRRKMQKEGCRVKVARNAGYAWLAENLGIKKEDCHIGMFDIETCRKVIKFCIQYTK